MRDVSVLVLNSKCFFVSLYMTIRCHLLLAIVMTGSGKSTTLAALLRLAPIHRGSVTIDGIDVCTVPLRRLRSAVGVVPQHPLVFEGASVPLWVAVPLCLAAPPQHWCTPSVLTEASSQLQLALLLSNMYTRPHVYN